MGFAMGNPLSPVLANFFLEHVESEFLSTYPGVLPNLWLRYVDDVLAFVDDSFNLGNFLSFINSRYPSLEFSYEWEVNNSIPFLDVNIIKNGSFSSL